MQLRDLYKYGYADSKAEKDRQRARMEKILRRIYQRFPGEAEAKLQVKHLRWFLMAELSKCKPSTRYRYWCDIRFFCSLLGKSENWVPLLKGPWQHRTGEAKPDRHPGGRPPKRASAQKIADSRANKPPGATTRPRRRRVKRRGRDQMQCVLIDQAQVAKSKA